MNLRSFPLARLDRFARLATGLRAASFAPAVVALAAACSAPVDRGEETVSSTASAMRARGDGDPVPKERPALTAVDVFDAAPRCEGVAACAIVPGAGTVLDAPSLDALHCGPSMQWTQAPATQWFRVCPQGDALNAAVAAIIAAPAPGERMDVETSSTTCDPCRGRLPDGWIYVTAAAGNPADRGPVCPGGCMRGLRND